MNCLAKSILMILLSFCLTAVSCNSSQNQQSRADSANRNDQLDPDNRNNRSDPNNMTEMDSVLQDSSDHPR